MYLKQLFCKHLWEDMHVELLDRCQDVRGPDGSWYETYQYEVRRECIKCGKVSYHIGFGIKFEFDGQYLLWRCN